jgi:hypothetical protein
MGWQPVTEDAPMPADLFRRFGAAPAPAAAPAVPEAAFAARARLLKLRDALTRAAKNLRPRWGEPTVFFFDKKRQAELEAARPAPPDRFAEITTHITSEMPALLSSVEVRRIARALGLKHAAQPLAARCPAANDLAELLAVPDDEVFLVLTPAAFTGLRLHLRGAAGVAQLHKLLGPGAVVSEFQFFEPAALRPDGTLPEALTGCGHWLWTTQPLAAVPRVNGERVVLVGPAMVRASLDVEPRFPALAVECELIETLTPVQVAEKLSHLCGRPVAVPAESEVPPAARAA